VALVPEMERQSVAEGLRQTQLAACPITQPDPVLVATYHGGPGQVAWLDRLESAFETLRQT
jgi:hypothetical protein